jgi:hypothetical protein
MNPIAAFIIALLVVISPLSMILTAVFVARWWMLRYIAGEDGVEIRAFAGSFTPLVKFRDESQHRVLWDAFKRARQLRLMRRYHLPVATERCASALEGWKQ